MSVIKSKRTLSDLEFYRNAIKLRKEITLLLLRDFGIKSKVRKLKKLRKKLDNGEIDYKDIETSYKSWRGNLKHYSSYHTLKNMDNLYNELFITQFIERGI